MFGFILFFVFVNLKIWTKRLSFIAWGEIISIPNKAMILKGLILCLQNPCQIFMYSFCLSCNSDKSLWLKSWKKKFKVPHWKSRSSEIGCIKQVFEQNHQDPNFSYVERFAQNSLNDQSSKISLKFPLFNFSDYLHSQPNINCKFVIDKGTKIKPCFHMRESLIKP